jgi:hypothetical protein
MRILEKQKFLFMPLETAGGSQIESYKRLQGSACLDAQNETATFFALALY